MKRKVAFVLCVAMLVCMVSNALAAVKFSKFTMTFSDTTSYQSITSDTTSVAKAADTDYARLYVTATSSSKNNVYRTYKWYGLYVQMLLQENNDWNVDVLQYRHRFGYTSISNGTSGFQCSLLHGYW